jgi:hypothetical protein
MQNRRCAHRGLISTGVGVCQLAALAARGSFTAPILEILELESGHGNAESSS